MRAREKKSGRMFMAGSPSAFQQPQEPVESVRPAAGSRHVPQRTCIGCRKKDDQAALMRLALDSRDGIQTVQVDESRRMSGRGAWLHPEAACLATAVKRRAFGRAFRAQVDPSGVERWFEAQEAGPNPGPPRNRPT
ncbi:YlxR family protein [Arthrobacter pullicola]|nr:YlxR family protein [Arthrobacter pullicola]